MAKETLYCELGNHKWTRESTRGRKPHNCDKHKPAVIVQANSVVQKKQTLHCEIGNHSWERPSARGVKPHNCPDHKPVLVTPSRLPADSPLRVVGSTSLYCETGDHKWERPAQRGRKPKNCPEHSGAVPPRSIPVRVISDSFPVAEIADDDLPIVEVEGEYESETSETEQRELLTAAFNPTPKRGPGRPRIHETKEEQEEAARQRSIAKLNSLEDKLKARGTHISQQEPYALYKLVNGIAGTADAKYDFVRMFSPLHKAQFINQFPDRFDAGIYYFERNGERVDE